MTGAKLTHVCLSRRARDVHRRLMANRSAWGRWEIQVSSRVCRCPRQPCEWQPPRHSHTDKISGGTYLPKYLSQLTEGERGEGAKHTAQAFRILCNFTSSHGWNANNVSPAKSWMWPQGAWPPWNAADQFGLSLTLSKFHLASLRKQLTKRCRMVKKNCKQFIQFTKEFK